MKILIIMGIVVRMRAKVAKVGNLVMLEILHFFYLAFSCFFGFLFLFFGLNPNSVFSSSALSFFVYSHCMYVVSVSQVDAFRNYLMLSL